MVDAFIEAVAGELDKLFAFARALNELDLAASMGPEFRGAQDAGWTTADEAVEIYAELQELLSAPISGKRKIRSVLCLYMQLAEASGYYEILRNVFRVIENQVYSLWPYSHLVQV